MSFLNSALGPSRNPVESGVNPFIGVDPSDFSRNGTIIIVGGCANPTPEQIERRKAEAELDEYLNSHT